MQSEKKISLTKDEVVDALLIYIETHTFGEFQEGEFKNKNVRCEVKMDDGDKSANSMDWLCGSIIPKHTITGVDVIITDKKENSK